MRALLRPRYWPGHLAMVVCVAIAAGLGFWQLDAWRQHRAEAARDLANEKPVALSAVMTGDSPFPGRSLGRPVTFSGRWLGDTTYVSDRDQDGRTGYWVVTPVLVSGSQSAMPVVRGWATEPEASPASGDVRLTGWLQATEGSGGLDEDPHDDVIPSMRVASLVEHVDADLYSGFVVARDLAPETARDGLEAVPPPSVPEVSMFTAARNFFYAVEWWIFGGFALFIWVRWCYDSLAVLRAAEPGSSDAEPTDGAEDDHDGEPAGTKAPSA